jgi:hypothetical protein
MWSVKKSEPEKRPLLEGYKNKFASPAFYVPFSVILLVGFIKIYYKLRKNGSY